MNIANLRPDERTVKMGGKTKLRATLLRPSNIGTNGLTYRFQEHKIAETSRESGWEQLNRIYPAKGA